MNFTSSICQFRAVAKQSLRVRLRGLGNPQGLGPGLQLRVFERLVIDVIPSLGRGVAGSEVAGRGHCYHANPLNPSLHPPKGGNRTWPSRAHMNLSNTRNCKSRLARSNNVARGFPNQAHSGRLVCINIQYRPFYLPKGLNYRPVLALSFFPSPSSRACRFFYRAKPVPLSPR